MGTFGWGKVQKVTSAPPKKKTTTKQNKTKHEANMEMGQKTEV